MKKGLICLLGILLTINSLQTNVFAYNYNFGETYQRDDFGVNTSSEEIADYSNIENIRRNKDVTNFAPSYGVFSGEFETNRTSPYHTYNDNLSKTYEVSIVPDQYSGMNGSQSFLQSTSNFDNSTDYSNSTNIYYNNYENDVYNRITSVSTYSDGSIGYLEIPSIKLKELVYSGTDDSTLSKTIGHFTYTSEWDGNVGLASHNRGTGSYFSEIDTLEKGDRIKYTTKEGTRQYEVFSVSRENEDDVSALYYSYDNIITLVTCVRDVRDERWVVQAKEIK